MEGKIILGLLTISLLLLTSCGVTAVETNNISNNSSLMTANIYKTGLELPSDVENVMKVIDDYYISKDNSD